MNSSSWVPNVVVVDSGRNSFTASRTSCYVLQPLNVVWGWGGGVVFNRLMRQNSVLANVRDRRLIVAAVMESDREKHKDEEKRLYRV